MKKFVFPIITASLLLGVIACENVKSSKPAKQEEKMYQKKNETMKQNKMQNGKKMPTEKSEKKW